MLSNVFLKPDIHKKDLHNIHFSAWKKGIKSLYYLRSMSLQRAEVVNQDATNVKVPLKGKINENNEHHGKTMPLSVSGNYFTTISNQSQPADRYARNQRIAQLSQKWTIDPAFNKAIEYEPQKARILGTRKTEEARRTKAAEKLEEARNGKKAPGH